MSDFIPESKWVKRFPGSCIKSGARIESGVTIRPGANIERWAHIGRGSFIGSAARIGRGSLIGSAARIGSGARVEPGVAVWPGAHVDPNRRITRDVHTIHGPWIATLSEHGIRIGCEPLRSADEWEAIDLHFINGDVSCYRAHLLAVCAYWRAEFGATQ